MPAVQSTALMANFMSSIVKRALPWVRAALGMYFDGIEDFAVLSYTQKASTDLRR